jgi:predicted Mrr-cat superfamily restriction endonuclease
VTVWGIHNNKPAYDFVEDGRIAVGWRRIGDLRAIGNDRDALKAALAATHPEAKPRAIPVWAGVLLRFAFEMRPGDLVVHPCKADSTLSFGRVAGDYVWEPDAPPDNRHRRPVEWLEVGVPRMVFSESARYELGSSITLFRVRRNADELRAVVEGAVV